MPYSSSSVGAAGTTAASALPTLSAGASLGAPASSLGAPSLLGAPGVADQFALTGAGLTGAAGGQEDLATCMMKCLTMMVSILQTLMGGQGAGSLGVPAGVPATGGVLQGAALPAAAVAADANPRVAVIDNFVDDGTGFNHGAEMDSTIGAGGAVGTLDINMANMNGSVEQRIDAALKDVLARKQAGEDIDVVNLSQFVGTRNATTESIRQTMDQLGALGVPVVVAAGNFGPNERNVLGDSANAIVVENVVNGAVSNQSGQGNAQFNGRTTSFATAGLSSQIAQRLAQGQSLAQIMQSFSA